MFVPAALMAAAGLMLALQLSRPVDSSTTDLSVDRDALPVASLTPGASSGASVQELCGLAAGERRLIPAAMQRQILHDYRMEQVPSDEYELDYLITPELGGATDTRNLWPQRYSSRVWNAHVKDQLEHLLPAMVCSGQLQLETAQRDIAVNWIAAYQKYFKTRDPLEPRVRLVDDDEPPRIALMSFPARP